MKNLVLTFVISMMILAIGVTIHFQLEPDLQAQEGLVVTDLPTAEEVLADKNEPVSIGSFFFGFVGGVSVGALVLFLHMRTSAKHDKKNAAPTR